MLKVFLIFLSITSIHAAVLRVDSVKQIHELISSMHQQGEFNGSILVAVEGNVVYKGSFGLANVKRGEGFTTTTASCIASVTKQFTATGIMLLAQQGALHYDDPVSKYIKLPRCYNVVTIRHLLTHTSGVTEYSHLGQGSPDKLIAKQTTLRFDPGQKYEYSNSNYVLLSQVIEKITGQSYPEFVTERFFMPVGMTGSFPGKDASHNGPGVAIGYSQFGKVDDSSLPAIFGDGGIYSTVEDLLKWDQILYTDKIVKQSTLAEAFRPAQVREGMTTYGFGWNITSDTHGKRVWHTGNTAGFRAYIERNLDKHITIIILTNTGPSKRLEIAEAINNILENKPYKQPKISISKKLYAIISEQGIDEGIKFYHSAFESGKDVYDFSEPELNGLGYQLLYDDNKTEEAIKIFHLNTEKYPGSSNAFDSLGEAFLKKGEKGLAISNYKRALEIDPANTNAANMLKKIQP